MPFDEQFNDHGGDDRRHRDIMTMAKSMVEGMDEATAVAGMCAKCTKQLVALIIVCGVVRSKYEKHGKEAAIRDITNFAETVLAIAMEGDND